jgi:hypothetical protein
VLVVARGRDGHQDPAVRRHGETVVLAAAHRPVDDRPTRREAGAAQVADS